LPAPRRNRRRVRTNGPERRGFAILAGTLIVCMIAAWAGSIAVAYRERLQAEVEQEAGDPASVAPPSATRSLSASLTDSRANSTAYLEDAALGTFLEPLLGQSGKLRAVQRTPGAELSKDIDPHYSAIFEEESGGTVAQGLTAPQDPGIYKLAVELGKARRSVNDLRLITLVPFSEKKKERIGLYYLGSWPYEDGGTPRSASYANPKGFIEVTKQNKDTAVSEHFKLGQFLTKDQFDVWPKYVIIEPKLLDKLELAVTDLKAQGVKIQHVHVMSGFRTPRYNKGGGNTGGRANLSRHMYGDGADVYVDNNRDGQPDDITGDGRVDLKDAELFGRAVERVESKYPALVGGVGLYKACCGHGPFTHVDTRGYRARWRGEGSG
jgi:hypothetical protein